MPSSPFGLTVRIHATCSTSHVMIGCSSGMRLPTRASRHDLHVLNIPLTCFTAFSTDPFDLGSYVGGFSKLAWPASSASVVLIAFRDSRSNLTIARSPSVLRISLVYPSHCTSSVTRATAYPSSSTPFCRTACANTTLLFVSFTTKILSLM